MDREWIRRVLPETPRMGVKELEQWMRENGGRGREVLRYRRKKWVDPLSGEKMDFAECECTVCRSKWEALLLSGMGGYPRVETAEGFKSNGEYCFCPECGANLEVAYVGRLRRHPIVSIKYPWEIVRKDGNIIFLCWAVFHEIGDDYDSIEVQKRNAYLLDTAGKWHRFTAMERSGWSMMSKMEYIGTWYKKERFDVPDGNVGYMLPHEQNVYEGTLLENAKVEKLEALGMGADLLHYARIYMRHKAAENITMHSPHLMAAMVWWSKGVTGLDYLNWKAVKPHEILRVTKPEYKALCKLAGEDAKKVASSLYVVNACELWGTPRDYAKTLGEVGAGFAFSQKKNKALRQFGLVTIWNYILKQQKGDRYSAVSLCVDYWEDLPRIGADLSDRAVMFPADVKRAHARVIEAIKYEENKELQEKFAKVREKLEPLKWEHNGLLIMPAESESQLIAEGKILSHCVGGYGSAHCNGQSIFFIRHTEDAAMPFFTLQLDTKTGRVLQNRGLRNCSRTKEVEEFEKAWLEIVVAPWMKSNKRKEKKTA